MKTPFEALTNWSNECLDEIDITKDKHWVIKSFGIGAIEGYIKIASIMYIPVLISGVAWAHKALKKEG